MTAPIYLRPASDADFDTLIAGLAPTGLVLADGGIETPEVLAMLQGLARNIREAFEPAAWMIVCGDHIAGMVSLLHAPDADGAVAIGYGIAASQQNSGICTAAIAELALWAAQHKDIRKITAETSITNIASQAVLTKNGFVTTGQREDPEDGALLCWALTNR